MIPLGSEAMTVIVPPGRFEESIQGLELDIARGGDRAPPRDWAFLSMAHSRRGNRAVALRWLDRLRKYKPSADPERFRSNLEFRLLRREAKALVRDRELPAR